MVPSWSSPNISLSTQRLLIDHQPPRCPGKKYFAKYQSDSRLSFDAFEAGPDLHYDAKHKPIDSQADFEHIWKHTVHTLLSLDHQISVKCGWHELMDNLSDWFRYKLQSTEYKPAPANPMRLHDGTLRETMDFKAGW